MSTLLTNNVQIDSFINIAWLVFFTVYLMTVQTLTYCARKHPPDSPCVKKKASHRQIAVTQKKSTVTNTLTGPSTTSPTQAKTKDPIVREPNAIPTKSHEKKVKKVKKVASNTDPKKKTSKPSKPSNKSSHKTSTSKKNTTKNTTKKTEEKPRTKHTKDKDVKVEKPAEKTAEKTAEVHQTQTNGDTKVFSITKLNETQTCENLLKTSIDKPHDRNKDEGKLNLEESEDDDDLTLKDVKSLDKDDRPPTIDE